jgi:hypothetical protein
MSRPRLLGLVGSGLGLALVVLAAPGAADDAAPRPAPAPRAGPSVTPPALDDVEHMCALVTGCERLPLPQGLVPSDFAGCVRSVYGALASGSAVAYSLTLRECGLRASSCHELRACALRGARPDICAGRGKDGPVDMCDGDGRAITCLGERVAAVRDCPRGGEQCAVVGGHAACTLGPCEADAPAACSRSGTRILECRKRKLVSLDCGAFALRCDSSPAGPRCATQGAACTEGASRCEGDAAISCWHGHEVRVECGAGGLSCGGSGAAVGACTVAPVAAPPAEGSCDPDSAPRCDGATLRWCAWGSPRSYLCKSMGLSRCVSDAKGGARCAG